MSESSKMGLFGSKDDKTESTSADTDTKPDTADRYAPYCIDSDSETYDTEALSIMDINDIIGVQTENATESTLESEIAALTEIMTESKGDTNSDPMNDIDEESSDIKFNDELLTEFTALSPSENPIPTTSKEGSEKDGTEDPSSKETPEVETDVKILDEATTIAEKLDTVNIEAKVKPESGNEEKKESLLSSAMQSFDDAARNDEISTAEEDKLLLKTDTLSTNTSSEVEATPQFARDLLEDTLEAAKISLDDETIREDKDLSKEENDAPAVSVEDAAKISSNLVDDVDSVLKTESEKKEVADDPEDEKLEDLLTNVGSTSKSLQLIGEAYISEDSQEMNDSDASPVIKVASVPLDTVRGQEIEEKENELQQKESSDNLLINTMIDESETNVTADITASADKECILDNQDSTLLEDNKEPDNTKEALLNLEDNHESRDLASSIELQTNFHCKNDQVIGKDKSVDPSLHGDENTDKTKESDEATSIPIVSIDPGSSNTTETTEMKEVLETKEESPHESEQLEDISTNVAAEISGLKTEDEVLEPETNSNSEELQEKLSDKAKLVDETMDSSESDVDTLKSNTEPVLETDNFSIADSGPLEDSEALSSILPVSSTTESKNPTEMDSEIQNENTEVTQSVEPLESIAEQDNAVCVEPNIDKELLDSQSNEESLTMPHSVVEDKTSEQDSQSSVLPVEVCTNSEDDDDQHTTTNEFTGQIISTEEQSKEIPDNNEQLPETMQADTEEHIIDNAITEKDTPLIKVEDEKIEDNGGSSIHKMIEGIKRAEAEKDSERRRLCNDDTTQLVSMEITSPIGGETSVESSNVMPTKEDDLAVEDSKDTMDEAENMGIELDQSASMSSVENNTPPCDIIEPDNQEETVEECSSAGKDNFTETETIELSETKLPENEVEMKEDIGSRRDTTDSETLGSIITEDVPESTMEDAGEDIIPASIGVESLENVEPELSDDNSNKAEIIEKSQEPEEIREAQTVDSDTQVESKSSETDEAEISKIETSDEIQKLEEKELVSELSVDTDNKQAEETSDKENKEIEESNSTTEPDIDTISDKTATVTELSITSEINTMQGPLENIGHSQSKPEPGEDEVEPKIQQIQHEGDGREVLEDEQGPEDQSESTRNNEEVQCPNISQPNSECSSGDAEADNKSEILFEVIADEKQGSSELQLENFVNKADLQIVTDKSLHPVPCEELSENLSITESEPKENLVENSSENTFVSEIGAKELLEIQSEPVGSKDVSKFLEKEEELEEKRSLTTKPVDDKNLDDLFDIHSLEDTLALSQTPSVDNEVENNSAKTVLSLIDETAPLTLPADILLDSEVKLDEDLLCEPIEVLEKLVVVADEILIDELTNSVLKDTPEPLENISNLAILADSPLSATVNSEELKVGTLTNVASEIEEQPASLLGEVNETCFIGGLNETPSVSHGADYITDVIISSTNIDSILLTDNVRDMDDKNATADEFEEKNQREILKTSENLISEDMTSIDQSITSINTASELGLEENLVLDKDIEIDLPLEQEERKLIESVALACDTKIEIPDEVLFDVENAEQNDILCRTSVDNVDTSQQSSEFSELECAVKFLQESEEQTIDSPLLLSPKIVEEIVEENSEQSKSCLFLSGTEGCQETLDLPAELGEEIIPDSIAISEAEIISEAAKLENERKLKIAAEMSKTSVDIGKSEETDKSLSGNNSEMLKSLLTSSEVPNWQEKSQENVASTSGSCENTQIPKLSTNIIRRSEKIPKISILEERLKEPPKIEIPVPEVSPKISDTPTTPKTSLLMQRDSRIDTKTMYQKMLESPKGGEKSEPKISDTPRKDSEKYEFENVGSPRIILKIAKSAIADCGEPRSPKSPKIRSAANSPNPEDSPGQKLGKIKLKLSKGGHPSIISNENFDDTAQRHTEAISSPSHIGMKIKLSKSGDASIIQPEKHDSIDEIKESKHKFGEASPKRIESPLGMKIKLSKTGDPSIVQQESKDSTLKRKDKLDIGQEIPKRTDSPIGMKIKLSKSGDASIIQPEKQESFEDAAYRDKFEMAMDIPKRTDSPIGMKIKLSKSGDASIISSDNCDEFKDSSSKSRDKLNTTQDIPKRTDSPLGMKFKLSKSGGASIIQPEKSETSDDFREQSENISDITKRVESPIGMKIKLLKTGDASIIHPEKQESDDHRESIIIKHREKSEIQEIQKRTDSPLGMRIKVTKSGEASVVPSEEFSESIDMTHEVLKRNESPIGMKIKLSKSGDASIIHPEKQEFYDESKDCRGSLSATQEGSKMSESSLGMKIKLSKTGDASIIHPDISPESKDSQFKRSEKLQSSGEGSKRTDSPLGMKIKLSKTGDASIIEPDKKEKPSIKLKEKLANTQEVSQKRKEMEYPLEMKIKLSKTGHPTIIANEKQEAHAEMHSKSKDYSESGQSTYHKRTESISPSKDSQLRIFKTGHSTIIQSSRSEVTIEPIQMLKEQPESSVDISPKCKEMIISQMDLKKSKLEAKLSHILPEVTIQPVMSGEQKQIVLDKKSSSISRQQMSVINQEISITHVPPSKPADLSMSGKLKEILRKNATNSPANSDCEIIEHRPELIIVNENSNSSQDIMIIEEVKAIPQEVKVPRKRGRPKRSSLPPPIRQVIPSDPLALDGIQSPAVVEHRESDRPKRTCRNQKSYAPPKRGRGRGRGKRKMDRVDCAIGKIPRLEDPLTAIERSTMSLIAPLQQRMLPEATAQTSELYKALKQGPMERKRLIAETVVQHGFSDPQKKLRLETESGAQSASDSTLPAVPISDQHSIAKTDLDTSDSKAVMISEMLQLAEPITAQQSTEKLLEAPKPEAQETKNIISEMNTTEHQNWLTPSIKLPETTGKTEAISMVQVMDEETRMSAESNSRSQTPARNISIPVVETVINEESQGSVLSTATTESEKVKVKNRRMEINFDPDEGPFTVDKIAEYEWPLDKKGDTFMLQEQISQYLGVKSFKRKYPDLKRRMVEMEERNYLRENCLVSEAMCDMGLTAICSTEVLDIMCSDFPDQYEEYRKHMREKQAKEHSKKQKELTAAANAERNRIDLAEMAVQSALSWNVNFNKARKESRKYSLDLQSFTIHVPKKQLKVDAERKASNYPVALIPGQYTDYYREYTPAELRYYPLNTVLYGPMRPNERKFDSQSEGSQSDSDSDSSSDDSSSSSSEGTQDTEESQSTVDEVDMDTTAHKEDNKNLKCKMCLKHLNKHGKAEVLIQCGTCNGNVHPSCIDLTLDMVPHIQGYSWQCTDCKTCVQCHNPADEDKMLFCDMCDRGYHIYCVGLRRVPQGRWHCRECAVCASCGLRQPGGANSDRNSVAQWQHEYKKGERNTRVYVSTLCVPCSKLWRKGRYCPHCSRCHSAQRLDQEPNLVHCGACDKYLHLGCVEIRSGTLDRKNYICECCSTPSQLSRSSMSKNYKT